MKGVALPPAAGSADGVVLLVLADLVLLVALAVEHARIEGRPHHAAADAPTTA